MKMLLFMVILLTFPVNYFSLTFSENFDNFTNIDTANTNLTVVTEKGNVRLPFTAFVDLGYTGTTPLTSIFIDNSVLSLAYGDNMFLIGGSGAYSADGGKIASYDGSAFTDRYSQFIGITSNYNMAIFANGYFYISTDVSGGELIRFNLSSGFNSFGDYLNSFSSSIVNSLGANGTYWLIGGSQGRLNRWDGSTGATSLSNSLQGSGGFLATDTVSAIANNSSYWLLGGTNGRLAKYDGTSFTDLSTSSTLGTYNVMSIGWNGSEFLIGGNRGKLVRYNGSTFTSCTSTVTSTNGGCFGTADINAIVWNGLDWVLGGTSGRLCLYDSTNTTPVTSDFTAVGTNTTGTTKTTLLSSSWGTSAINAMCWSGSSLLIGGAVSNLNKTNGIYSGTSAMSIVSKKINSAADRVYSVALNATALSNGQPLSFYASCDGGVNWQLVQNNNSATSITNTGFDLRWRADMTGAWRTPSINGVSLTYLTVDPLVLPRGLAGDIVYSGDVLTKLTVPPDALTSDVKFTFLNTVIPPISSQTPKTAVVAYDLTAKINGTSTDVTEFSKPLTLTIHWKSTDGAYVDNTGNAVQLSNATTSLAIAFWNGLHWIPMSTKITKVGNDLTLTAKISHFSKYAIVVASPTDIIATAEPNPFTPLSASSTFSRTKITFPNPDQVTAVLKIWDRNGSLMREYSLDGVSQIEWDGKDAQGAVVESGVYFFEAIAGGTSRARGTVVVGR